MTGTVDDMAHLCPDCFEVCVMIYGSGWDYDFIFCECGYEEVLGTSSYADYTE